MSKHFISPDWKALRKLPDYLQRAWFYMWDKCDPAGVYEYDEDYMKLDLSLQQAISKLELTQCPEVIILPTGQLFIKNFIEINYGTLKEGYNPHKPTFRSIEKYNLSSFIQASFKLEDEDEEEGKDEEEDFLKKEGAGEKNFLSELDKSETGKPVSFQKSKWFDKSVFFAEVPQDWPQAKRENYYEAALAWSQDNPKKKKVDWIRAVRLWDNNHPWQEGRTGTSTRPQTENQRLNDIARNGGHLKTDEKKWVQIRGKITQGEFELDGEGNMVMYCGRETLKVYPNDGFRSNVLYDLKPGNTIQEVHQYLLSERKLQIAS